MPLYPGDVSEYVDSRADPARLTVEITAPETPGGSYHSRGILDGGRTVEGTFTPPPGDWEQTDPMTRAATKTRRARGATESAVETGRRLFDAVFSGPLSRCWAEAVERASGPHGLQVVVRSADLGVQGLGWELLYDPVLAGGHIMLVDGWSILREVPGQPAPTPPHTATENLAVLVVTSDYPLDLDTEQDIRLIADLLSDASIDVRRGVASSTVGRVLANARADVIHFAGTGMRMPGGRQQLAFGTPDKVRGVSGGSILEVLRTGPQRPTFLVLAACETDTLAAELAAEVPVVVGMRGAISDPGCVAFLQGFYGALRRGSPADQAVAAGRSQQFSFSRGVATEWATPVAFTAPGARLVRPPESGPVPRITTAGDDLAGAGEDRRQRLVLDMKRRNADALRDQWGPVEPALWPDFVRRQLADLESGIAEAQRDAGGTR
jgi:hypothetical protein